jgi:hypothetical protein
VTELPAGYEALDDPTEGTRGRPARTADGEAHHLFVGHPAGNPALAGVRALAWSRMGHAALLPIVAMGSEPVPWFATPAVQPVQEVELSDVVVALQGVCALHADGQEHGDLDQGLVRWGEQVAVRPPWPDAEPSDDRDAMARWLWRAVAEGPPEPDAEQLVLRAEAPRCVAAAIAMLWQRTGLLVDALLLLVEGGERAEAGATLPLVPGRPAVALPAPEPPEPPRQPLPPVASLRARRRVVATSPEARRLLWDEVREVASSGRPRVVCLRGPRHLLEPTTRWLRATLEREALAESLSLHRGTTLDLARALHPGGDDPAAFEAAWRRAHPDASDEEARVARRWCGPLEPTEVRAPPAVGRRELQRRIDAGSARGLFALTVDEAGAEAITLARDLLCGDRPVLVLLAAADEALQADPALQERFDALRGMPLRMESPDREAVAGWVEALELTDDPKALIASAEGDVGRLAVWLQHGADSGRPAQPAEVSDAVESLGRVTGAERRVRDAVHLASLSELPVGVARGFLGPVEGLWKATALASVSGGVVRIDERVAPEARRRADHAYLQRRLSRAWARSAYVEAAARAGTHAIQAGDRDFAETSWLSAARQAERARDGQLLAAICDAVEAHDGASATPHAWLRWRALATELCGRPAAEAWAAAQEAARGDGEQALEARATVGRLLALSREGTPEEGGYEALEAACRVAREADDVVTEALALFAQGLAIAQAHPGAAQQKHNKALHRLGGVDRPDLAAEVLEAQALEQARGGGMRSALEAYNDAHESWLEADEGARAARALCGAADCLVELDRLDEALEQARLAQGLARSWLDPEGVVRAVVVRARAQRHAGAESAGRRYERAARDAEALGLRELQVECHLGLSLLALHQGDQHAAYQATSAAAEVLEALPGHPLWARYRLAVAAQLAKRGDHTQTWQWLWSAKELGLEAPHRDIAELATLLCDVAREEVWGNVVRVAGDIAVHQLRRVGDTGSADRLRSDITGFISQ